LPEGEKIHITGGGVLNIVGCIKQLDRDIVGHMSVACVKFACGLLFRVAIPCQLELKSDKDAGEDGNDQGDPVLWDPLWEIRDSERNAVSLWAYVCVWIQFLGQREAQLFDEALMSSKYGFSIDQLMELAGLSVADAVGKQYPLASLKQKPSGASVLVVAGPGNNG
jgi:hypothetical protein